LASGEKTEGIEPDVDCVIMGDSTPDAALRFQKGTTRALIGGWPLLAATVWLVTAVIIGARDGITATSQDVGTILILLATMAGGAGALIWARLPPDNEAVPAFVGLAATVAALLALTPIETMGGRQSLPGFLLQAPWHYALIPLTVHFAFAIGWPHRRRAWSGVVVGWYLLHTAMFVAAAGGLAAQEDPLFTVVELTFRRRILDPAGIVTAIVALGIALGSPAMGRRQRRAIGWAFGAVALGLGPQALSWLVPALAQPLDGTMTLPRLALAVTPFLGLAAMLALPYVNSVQRDLDSHRLAHSLLDERDLAEGLRRIAADLHTTFEAEGVLIRLVHPPMTETLGVTTALGDGPLAQEVDVDEERRVLSAPVGRIGDPLGEVRLVAPHTGAFGRREREWLAAYLLPLAPVLRARVREATAATRLESLQQDMHEAASELGRLLQALPTESVDEGAGIPPEVDASMVLGQLTDSLDGVNRRSEDLETLAQAARARSREASDEIAQGLDAMRALATDLVRLATYRDEVAASNLAVSGVAFRTNLLANNAALEATRAGALGQTFGVLAEEIRRLADLTAKSSSEIDQRTHALTDDVTAAMQTLEQVQSALRRAIRDAESGEDSAGRVQDTAGAVLGWVRSLRPAVEEAHTVAARRSERDQRLSAMLQQALAVQAHRVQRLQQHRTDLGRVRAMLERQAGRAGGA
jgi:hypothetical protein